MEYKIKMCTDSFNDRWKIIGKADSLAEAREQATMLLMAGIPSRKKELMIFKVVNGSDDWLVRVSCDDTEIENIIKARLDLHKDTYTMYEINNDSGWTL